MNKELRQKFINSISLRLVQVFYDLWRKYPFYKSEKNVSPFFIIGSGRSGTTLLRSICQTHPKIHIPPESAALPGCVKKFIRYGGLDWQDLVAVILGEFQRYKAFDYWELRFYPEVYKKLIRVSEPDRNLQMIINAVYEAHMKKFKPTASIWGDKTPFNTLRLQWINKVYPNAKYIHLIRDPYDVVYSYIQSEIITDIEEASLRWIRANQRAENFLNKINKGRFIQIRYKDLVIHPQDVTHQIANLLQVKNQFDIQNRPFSELGDVVQTHHKNVQNPINTNSIGKGRKYLSKKEKLQVEETAASLIEYYGYC